MIRVLLAEDEAIVREGTRRILEHEPDIEVVAEAADGRGALELAASRTVDVALVDVRMPHLDGLATVAELHRRHPTIAALVLTTFDDQDYVARALAAGACGFLLKASDPRELGIAIRAAADGGVYLSPRVAAHVVRDLGPENRHRRLAARDRVAALSDREREVLGLLAQGCTNQQIGTALHLAESSVKTHVSALLQRLEALNRVQAAILAHEAGLTDPRRRITE